VNIHKTIPSGIFFGHPNCAREILESCGMWNDEDGLPINIKSCPPPLNEKDRSEFLSILMKLAYFAQQSPPDILFAVNKL
jgi:hypothetical protein